MGEAPPTGPWKGHSSGGTAGAYLTWEDLTVVLPSYTRAQPARRLIHGINGYAAPCRVLAIMGPSGSGKSTLLDALAGRLASNVMMQGTIKLNGRDRKMEHGEVAYVTQENTLLGTLTVRETIAYSANLRLPSTMTSDEVRGVVDALIAQMGLGECSDTVIGNWHLRGISGGERKRLSVALEVLTRPRVLFLDEPTSGLDSAAAFFVTATLAQMASDGMTVVCSVHQPSGEVFSLFGDLCLLSGGEVVYFGDSKVATQFFQQAGFECPMRQNPSDHFLRCINTDFDQVNKKIARSRRHYSSRRLNAIVDEELAMKTLDPIANMETSLIKARLVDRYMTSEYAIMVAKQIKEIHDLDGSIQFSRKGNQATWWKQLITLTRRSFANMSRDLGYYWIRIVVYIIVSLCVGTVFFNLGTTYDSILARTSSAAFIFGFMSLMSMGGFPSFIEEMKVFYHERLNGHFGVATFVLSNFISSIPFLLAVSTISSAITYYLVGLHPGFSHFIFFTANLYGCVAVVETIMMVVASFVPNFLMGIGVGAGIMGTSLLASGFMRLLSDLPKPFWRYPVSYMFYGSWALQGQYKNDMLSLEFDSSIPGGPKLKGEYLIQENFGVSLDHSKWIDLSIIFLLLLFYRLVFFLMIKVKERASPLLRLILTKVAYHQLQTNPDCKLGEMKGNIDF